MQITVTIPDEVAAVAHARGLTPESYVEELIAEQGITAKPALTREQRLANLEKFFEEFSANSENISYSSRRSLHS
jgi:hypothetical protein